MATKYDVIFQNLNGWGIIILNREKALNALTLEMVRRINDILIKCGENEQIRGVLIKGKGRAFCAGADIRALYNAGKNAHETLPRDFYREEYVLNRRIFMYPKPYIALLDGITMGGGAGISIHGTYRVVTENLLFAMPETGIGFFPDVGSTYFLSRLPGEIGMFLGLTGARIRAADMIYLGLGTHFIPAADIGKLEDALVTHCIGEFSTEQISSVLSSYSRDPGIPPLSEHRAEIDRCFGKDSVEEIISALKEEKTEWSSSILPQLLTKSPTSMKVTYRQIRQGKKLDFDTVLQVEYRLSQKFMIQDDYYEGVRATIIDKDFSPKWHPDSLKKVSAKDVDDFFEPVTENELRFH